MLPSETVKGNSRIRDFMFMMKQTEASESLFLRNEAGMGQWPLAESFTAAEEDGSIQKTERRLQTGR